MGKVMGFSGRRPSEKISAAVLSLYDISAKKAALYRQLPPLLTFSCVRTNLRVWFYFS